MNPWEIMRIRVSVILLLKIQVELAKHVRELFHYYQTSGWTTLISEDEIVALVSQP